jgi:cell division protein ZapA
MPLVNVMVNARAYTIACDEGEEEHLKELAGHVDSKVRELIGSVGQVGDQKLMLMAALLITDEFFEVRGRADGHARSAKDLAAAKADSDARIREAEKRAALAIEEAEKRAAEQIAEMEQRANAMIDQATARLETIAAKLHAA